MDDFDIFSAAWLSVPADSNWNRQCDIDRDWDVDLVDLVPFTVQWLWTACWHESYQEIWMKSSGGGDSLLMSESTLVIESENLLIPEQTLKEQITEAKWLIERVEEVWEDPLTQEQIDKKVWKEFIDSLYEWLGELEEMAEDELKEKL